MLANILLVEDEEAIREMVGFALKRAGYGFQEAEDAEQARGRIQEKLPDLILMDWMLPRQSGLDFARDLRRQYDTKHVPIIMLTARTEEDDKVKGLEVGADDYVTKPFSPKELLARIKAVLRRTAPQTTADTVHSGGLTLDPNTHRVMTDGNPVQMGPTEFRLLHFFMTHVERVYSRAQLLDLVWGNNVYVEERTVDVHIRRLRKVLEPGSYHRMIQTVRGAGYRFSSQGLA